MATEFTLLDQLKPCIHVLCWPCLGLQRKRRRWPLVHNDGRDDREYDPLERQGLLDDEHEATVASSNRVGSQDDEDAMSLHSNIGRAKSHRPELSSPHSPLHKLSRWQLLTSWLDVLRAAPRQPGSLSSENDHGGRSTTNLLPADTESVSQLGGPADDAESAELQRLKEAIVKAKSSARKKRNRRARTEAALAERNAIQEDIDWGPMQNAPSLPSQTSSDTKTGSSKEELTRPFGYQGQDSDMEEQEGVPDMAAEGGLFSLSTAKAKRTDHSSSGLSSNSLSSSGSSAYGRRNARERSRRALSDTVSNVTREDTSAQVDK